MVVYDTLGVTNFLWGLGVGFLGRFGLGTLACFLVCVYE